MLLLNYMAIAFHSVLGPVESSALNGSLMLMLKGMVGIFIVMLLIYVVIYVLGKVSDPDKKDGK